MIGNFCDCWEPFSIYFQMLACVHLSGVGACSETVRWPQQTAGMRSVGLLSPNTVELRMGWLRTALTHQYCLHMHVSVHVLVKDANWDWIRNAAGLGLL